MQNHMAQVLIKVLNFEKRKKKELILFHFLMFLAVLSYILESVCSDLTWIKSMIVS